MGECPEVGPGGPGGPGSTSLDGSQEEHMRDRTRSCRRGCFSIGSSLRSFNLLM